MVTNRRAIVVFLDSNDEQIMMIKMMIKSIELSNLINTDLIVFHNPKITEFKNRYLNNCYVQFIEEHPISYNEPFLNYHYINSISCMYNTFLSNYDYILKTDVDTLFTPKLNDFYPEKFTCGVGGYNNDVDTEMKLQMVGNHFGINKKKNYIKNLGSSWYGTSTEIIKIAKLTQEITEYLLNHEFKNSEGSWPGYYRGVSTMYASEIAINHFINDINIDNGNLDFPSTSNLLTSDHVHIHCWHTDQNFSKFKLFNKGYLDIKTQELNITKISDYCLFCAITGNQ